MGVSPNPHSGSLNNLNKITISRNQNEIEKSSVMQSQSKRSRLFHSGRPIRMKNRRRRVVLEGCRRPNSIEKKVRTLNKLIPRSSGNDQSMGLDGLFRETADYILSLQIKVKLMQIMVKELADN